MKLGGLMNTRRYNIVQRVGVIITVASLLILIGIHNPSGGYETTYFYTVAGVQSDPPVQPPKMTIREAQTKEEWEQVIAGWNAYNASLNKTVVGDLDFFQWRSEAALLYSVGTLGGLFFYALLVVIGGVVWVLTFADRRKET
jgi:hypothetical protein